MASALGVRLPSGVPNAPVAWMRARCSKPLLWVRILSGVPNNLEDKGMYQVRDGKKVIPTCTKCGCRLAASDIFKDTYYHFKKGVGDRVDAQNHPCPYLNIPLALINRELFITSTNWKTPPEEWEPA